MTSSPAASSTLDFKCATGISDYHIDFGGQVPLAAAAATAVEQLRDRGLKAGFELAVASGYRNFERQLIIWNAKARGERPILDDAGHTLDPHSLNDEERVFAILRWSALPGASRHHWGSDMDVYDMGPCRDGHWLQLSYAETQSGGPFAPFHRWLDTELARPETVFFRPYTRWEGGIAPEPWHLSYAPLARDFQKLISPNKLMTLIERTDIALKTVILANFDEIYERFIWVDWHDYPAPWRPAEV